MLKLPDTTANRQDKSTYSFQSWALTEGGETDFEFS